MRSDDAARPAMCVFDLGQVLISWDPYLSQPPDASRAEWDAFVRRTDFWTFNRRLDAGEPLDQARRWFARRHGRDVEFLDRYIARYGATVRGPMPGMGEVVRGLKERGVRVGGLSNWPTELFHYAREGVALLGELEDVVVSGPLGMRKPDAQIYRHMLTHYGVTPHQVVFVDDSPENVRGAAALGIDAVRFTGADALTDALRARGLAADGR